MRAEFPGVEHAAISIDIDGHTLVISAEKRQESEGENEGYHCVESTYGAMQRVLCLPDDADGSGVEAKFKNGVLKLRIPKRESRVSNTRRITGLYEISFSRETCALAHCASKTFTESRGPLILLPSVHAAVRGSPPDTNSTVAVSTMSAPAAKNDA